MSDLTIAVLPCAGCGQSVVVVVNDWDEPDASGAYIFEGSRGRADRFAADLMALCKRYGADVKQGIREVHHAHEN